MIPIIIGTVVGTVLGGILYGHYRAWRRRCAKRDKARAGELGKL